VNATERKGIVAAAIAATIALVVIIAGVLIDGGGDSIDLASAPEATTTLPPTAPQASPPPAGPDQSSPPDAPEPPGESQPPSESVPPQDSSIPPTTLPPDLPLRPGEGVEVTASRSEASADAVSAEVTVALLRELGYQVSAPADNEYAADEAYEVLARREADVWIAGRYLADDEILAQEFEGSTIGDLVAPVGELSNGASRVGLAIDRHNASELGITSLEDLLADPDVIELYDHDENGRPDVVICDTDPRCDEFIDVLDKSDLTDRVDLIKAAADDSGDEILKDYRDGQPVLFVLHEPNWLSSVLLTGGETVWLSLDDTAPVSSEIDLAECSDDPCRLGAEVNDLRSVSNICFSDENPAATGLLEAVTFDPIELAVFHAEVRSGRDPFSVSAVWIEEHRETVAPWIGAGRLAAVNIEPEPCETDGGGATNPA
jgi:ABC-type proline/glycine betaine transport system substrate-binding protein